MVSLLALKAISHQFKSSRGHHVFYPQTEEGFVTIQCDKRIARVNLAEGTAMLSSGKKGNGFTSYLAILGATQVPVPPDIIEELKANIVPSGPIQVI